MSDMLHINFCYTVHVPCKRRSLISPTVHEANQRMTLFVCVCVGWNNTIHSSLLPKIRGTRIYKSLTITSLMIMVDKQYNNNNNFTNKHAFLYSDALSDTHRILHKQMLFIGVNNWCNPCKTSLLHTAHYHRSSVGLIRRETLHMLFLVACVLCNVHISWNFMPSFREFSSWKCNNCKSSSGIERRYCLSDVRSGVHFLWLCSSAPWRVCFPHLEQVSDWMAKWCLRAFVARVWVKINPPRKAQTGFGIFALTAHNVAADVQQQLAGEDALCEWVGLIEAFELCLSLPKSRCLNFQDRATSPEIWG